MMLSDPDRAFRSVVFNCGQKMALRAFYFIRTLTKALTYYYIKRSEHRLLAALKNELFEGPLLKVNIASISTFAKIVSQTKVQSM